MLCTDRAKRKKTEMIIANSPYVMMVFAVVIIELIVGSMFRKEKVDFHHSPSGCTLCSNNGYGGCMRCGHRWNHVKGHDTVSCFPLCESCWSQMTPENRLPYYLKLRNIWLSSARDTTDIKNIESEFMVIKEAVLAGK